MQDRPVRAALAPCERAAAGGQPLRGQHSRVDARSFASPGDDGPLSAPDTQAARRDGRPADLSFFITRRARRAMDICRISNLGHATHRRAHV